MRVFRVAIVSVLLTKLAMITRATQFQTQAQKKFFTRPTQALAQ